MSVNVTKSVWFSDKKRGCLIRYPLFLLFYYKPKVHPLAQVGF